MSPTRQVKSKQRVADFGEVFTAPREVNAMLDLVAPAFERVESTFLDPACGDGNFLDEILRRKLKLVETVSDSLEDYERNALVALGAIYGVEIQADNVRECRARLLAIWREAYDGKLGQEGNDRARKQAEEIVELNIVLGDFLKGQTVDENGRDTGEPIYMYSWSYGERGMVKKREKLQDEPPKDSTPSLFDPQPVEPTKLDEQEARETLAASSSSDRDETEPTTESVKKTRRVASTTSKKRTKSAKKTAPPPNSPREELETPQVAIEPQMEEPNVEIVPATNGMIAIPSKENRFAIFSDERRSNVPNVIELAFPIIENIMVLLDEDNQQTGQREDVAVARNLLQRLQKTTAWFWLNLEEPGRDGKDEVVASYKRAKEYSIRCAFAVKGLPFLGTFEKDEFVSQFNQIANALSIAYHQGVQQ